MHFFPTVIILLSLSFRSVLGGTWPWIAIFADGDTSCQGKYFEDEKLGMDKYRPKIKKGQIDWSPGAMVGNSHNISQFGINWGTGGDAFQFSKLFFYSSKGCKSGWLGTLTRSTDMDYPRVGINTCFTISDFDVGGVYQDGRAVQCIKTNKGEGKNPPGFGVVHVTDECPNGC